MSHRSGLILVIYRRLSLLSKQPNAVNHNATDHSGAEIKQSRGFLNTAEGNYLSNNTNRRHDGQFESDHSRNIPLVKKEISDGIRLNISPTKVEIGNKNVERTDQNEIGRLILQRQLSGEQLLQRSSGIWSRRFLGFSLCLLVSRGSLIGISRWIRRMGWV